MVKRKRVLLRRERNRLKTHLKANPGSKSVIIDTLKNFPPVIEDIDSAGPTDHAIPTKRQKKFRQYIAKKWKKEERNAILEKLASTSKFSRGCLKSTPKLWSRLKFKKELRPSCAKETCMDICSDSESTVLPPVGNFFYASFEEKPLPDHGLLYPFSKNKMVELKVSGPNSILSSSESIYSKPTKEIVLRNDGLEGTKGKASLINTNTPLQSSANRKTFYILPNRTKNIQEQRMKLPVCQEEHRIMDMIEKHSVIVLCGETGSGKTTQVPQFLYEAGYSHPESEYPNLIGITQPRRVAAISMSHRVGIELNDSNVVSYHVRFENSINSNTRVQFMTDGILLREISADMMLSRYSVIIIDEAHERNLNTDILIGILSRVVKHRNKLHKEWQLKKQLALAARDAFNDSMPLPFKLIIMSATLRVTDFTENRRLFSSPPPVIHIEGRQYPVTIHFNRITPRDHLKAAFSKVCEIHENLPSGGILVFVTGQSEVYELVKKIQKKYNAEYRSSPRGCVEYYDDSFTIEERLSELDDALLDCTFFENEELQRDNEIELNEVKEVKEEDFNICLLHPENPSPSENLYFPSKSPIENSSSRTLPSRKKLKCQTVDIESKASPLLVLPFYSLLSSEEQLKVFQTVPEGCRLCVIATNIAETSITIPGIRYVVDCGKFKAKEYDPQTSAESFSINWISKASADQRAGRAGRIGPGHCYRLFSSSVFDRLFPLHSKPEILNIPIEAVVLHLKAMNIDFIMNFPFPTPPSAQEISKAEKLLRWLGAIDVNKKITKLGVQMSHFPLHPRFSKILLLGMQKNLIKYAIALVAILSVGDLFLSNEEIQVIQGQRNEDILNLPSSGSIKSFEILSALRFKELVEKFSDRLCDSDLLMMLSVLGAFEYSNESKEFCAKHNLRYKSFQNIMRLRKQLEGIVKALSPKHFKLSLTKLTPPSDEQCYLLKQLILAGFIDQVAYIHPNPPEPFMRISKNCYQSSNHNGLLLIDRNSILHTMHPEAITFVRIYKGSKNSWLKGVTKIDPSWIVHFQP